MKSGRKSGEPFLITKGLHCQWNNILREFFFLAVKALFLFSTTRFIAGLSICPSQPTQFQARCGENRSHFRFTAQNGIILSPFVTGKELFRCGAMVFMWHCSIELDIEQTFGISNWFYRHEVQGNIDIWNT